MREGARCARDGRYPEALARYTEACDAQPDHPHAWCNRGGVALLAGGIGEAEQSYRRALEFASELAEARRGLAQALLAAHQWDNARTILAHADADDPTWTYLRAVHAEGTGDPAAAEILYRAAVEGGHAPAIRSLRHLFCKQNRPEDLARTFFRNEEHAPPEPMAVLAWLKALPDQPGRWRFAETLLDAHGGDAILHETLADGFLYLHAYAYAARVAARALRELPELNLAACPSIRECAAWLR